MNASSTSDATDASPRPTNAGTGAAKKKASSGATAPVKKKLKTGNDETTKTFLALLAINQIPVMEYLGEPLDALKLMYVCRDTRKAAARKLRQLQEEPATKWKQECFNQWLDAPTFLGSNDDKPTGLHRLMSTGTYGMAGPLRLKGIRATDGYFKERFVVLQYERDYSKEKCLLAIFEGNGQRQELFAIHELECEIEGSICDSCMPDPMLSFQSFQNRGIYHKCSSLSLKSWHPFDGISRIGSQGFLRYSIDVEDGCVLGPILFATSNFTLIDSFGINDVLSPTEVVCILWHALSADPNVIREYLWAFYDTGFEEDLKHWPEFLLPHGEDPQNRTAHYTLNRVREMLSSLAKEDVFDADKVERRVEDELVVMAESAYFASE